jgi:hypothetical protein
MATQSDDSTLDIGEQLARIARMRVETEKLIEENRLARPQILADIGMTRIRTEKLIQETRLATPQTFFQGALAMAALIGAGAALAKLFFPG